MALVVRDGNNASANLPNTGADATVYRMSDATITASATSATDIYQFKGAAAVVARIRRLKFMNIANVAAGAFAANSTLIQVLRRTTAGTTGTWTALNTSTTYAQSSAFTAAGAARAASGITLNVAGNTAFTVGTTAGVLDFGFLCTPLASKTDALAPFIPVLEWTYGNGGAYPIDVVGTSDYVVVNLNAVTPVATLRVVFEWEESTA